MWVEKKLRPAKWGAMVWYCATAACARVVICPSGGLLTGLSSLISDFPKDIFVPTYPKSDLELFASHPTRGAYHDRHGRGEGCGGGLRPVSDYQASGREMLQRTAKSCGPDAPAEELNNASGASRRGVA